MQSLSRTGVLYKLSLFAAASLYCFNLSRYNLFNSCSCVFNCFTRSCLNLSSSANLWASLSVSSCCRVLKSVAELISFLEASSFSKLLYLFFKSEIEDKSIPWLLNCGKMVLIPPSSPETNPVFLELLTGVSQLMKLA